MAPVYPQSEIAFRRFKAAFPTTLYTANESKLSFTLPNAAIIWFKSGEKPDNLYGEDVWAVVVDEASRLREEAWHAIRTTLSATQGRALIIGNVRGKKNWAWRLAREAEKGAPNLSYHRITAYAAIKAGILSQDDVEDARRLLPPAVFKELYLAEASDDGGNPFGVERIRACTGALSTDAPVVWGWDLAKSVDWTVGIALDARRRVCRFLRFQSPWEETIRTIKAETGKVRAIGDSTGVGDPIIEHLQRAGVNIEGYKFSSLSKQQLMEGLAVAIHQGLIGFPEGPITLELESFEYQYTRTGVIYSSAEGSHDDCVCALALANHGLVIQPTRERNFYSFTRVG